MSLAPGLVANLSAARHQVGHDISFALRASYSDLTNFDADPIKIQALVHQGHPPERKI